jgi:hypothetical protein
MYDNIGTLEYHDLMGSIINITLASNNTNALKNILKCLSELIDSSNDGKIKRSYYDLVSTVAQTLSYQDFHTTFQQQLHHSYLSRTPDRHYL